MRKADYKSRPGVLLVTHRQGLIVASRDVKNYAPDRRCGSFRGLHAKTTMSNAPHSFTARISRHHLVRLTQNRTIRYTYCTRQKCTASIFLSFIIKHRVTLLGHRDKIIHAKRVMSNVNFEWRIISTLYRRTCFRLKML